MKIWSLDRNIGCGICNETAIKTQTHYITVFLTTKIFAVYRICLIPEFKILLDVLGVSSRHTNTYALRKGNMHFYDADKYDYGWWVFRRSIFDREKFLGIIECESWGGFVELKYLLEFAWFQYFLLWSKILIRKLILKLIWKLIYENWYETWYEKWKLIWKSI